MDNNRYLSGLAVRRAVLGDAHVDRALKDTDSFNRPLQEWFTSAIWGDVWANEALPLKTRSLLTIAYLLALGRPEEIALHCRGALANGCTLEEIRETILHGAAYCGGPLASAAAKAVNQALASEIAAHAGDRA